jgi:hypothetical protein
MRRFSCTLLLMILGLNGCARWVSVSIPPELALAPEKGPHHVRLLMLDSSIVELRFAELDVEANPPAVTGRRDYPTREYVVVARDSVRSYQLRQSDGGASAMAAFLGLGLLVVSGGSGGTGIFGTFAEGLGKGFQVR